MFKKNPRKRYQSLNHLTSPKIDYGARVSNARFERGSIPVHHQKLCAKEESRSELFPNRKVEEAKSVKMWHFTQRSEISHFDFNLPTNDFFF